MGHYAMLGIIPKRKGQVLSEFITVKGYSSRHEIYPFITSIANRGILNKDVIKERLTESGIFYITDDLFVFSKAEKKSLDINNTLSSADENIEYYESIDCLLYTSPSPRDA